MFDPNMAHTPIEGKFQGGDRDGEDAKVVNFYDKDKLDVRNHGMYLLCNFRGIHQGEFKWDGNPSGEADKKHNIKV